MTFEIWDRVREGTAELYPETMTLFFHSIEDLNRWKSGQSFKLINHWVRPAPVPRGR